MAARRYTVSVWNVDTATTEWGVTTTASRLAHTVDEAWLWLSFADEDDEQRLVTVELLRTGTTGGRPTEGGDDER